jgi:hypothetical protein
MRLHTKVVAVMWQRPAIVWASTSVVGVRLGMVLFKFATSEDAKPCYEGAKAWRGPS